MARSTFPDTLAGGLIGPRQLDLRARGVFGRGADPRTEALRSDGRGPLGSGTPGGVLFVKDDGKAAKAATKRAKLEIKVRIVEFPAQKIFTESMRKSVTKSVKAELDTLAGKLRKSQPRFSVSWDRPKALPTDKLVPDVLLVYVIDNSQAVIDQSMDLLYKAFKSSVVKPEEVGEHLSNEGGVNVKEPGGLVSLSFCSVARIAKYPQNSGLDMIFADLVLHEIGHGMDADHDDGGVMRAKTVYGSAVAAATGYSDKSVPRIDDFLARL